MNLSLKKISAQEEKWGNELPKRKCSEYKYSRSYARFALSSLFNIDPLKIPLKALPGKPPSLKKGWGYISISHCYDSLLIGWSPQKIGVDIERNDRSFLLNQLVKRYFTDKERIRIEKLKEYEKKNAVLSNWVAKESALKWQAGELFKDLVLWELNEESNIGHHISLGLEVNIETIKYQKWFIGVAVEKNIHGKNLIICKN